MTKFCIKAFIATRIFYISTILITFNSNLISKYDLSPNIISSFDNESSSLIETSLLQFLSHFASYDAMMFLHIAQYSYTNDSNFAFFVLFPKVIKGLSNIINVLSLFSNETTSLLLSGFIISNTLCLVNAFLLQALIYRLTNSMIKSKICTLLFLINPGSVFYISIYSENLCFTFQLLFIFSVFRYNQQDGRIIHLCVLMILLITTRSNSILLCAFFVVPCLCSMLNKNTLQIFNSNNTFYNNLKKFIYLVIEKSGVFVKYIVVCVHSFLIFLLMTQYYPKQQICFSIKSKLNITNPKYALFEKYCYSQRESEIKNIYSYIQKEYWNVGLMTQFSLSSLDRVLLSMPMTICALYTLVKGYQYFDFYHLITKFDWVKFLLKTKHYNYSEKDNRINVKEIKKDNFEKDLCLNSFILGGCIYLVFLTFILIFLAHPQINNRLISGTPVIYYFISDDVIKFIITPKCQFRGLLVLIFFSSFSILSCFMQVGSYGFA